jgi:deoxyribonuclease V
MGGRRGLTVFQRILREALEQVPYGEVTTFKIIAEALGDGRAALAVRNECMRLSKMDPDIPWWRVVSSKLEPIPGAEEKLREEGGIERAKMGNFFRELDVWPVFKVMASDQVKLSEKLILSELGDVSVAAGVDVSYIDDRAVACCVTVDEELKIIEVRFERFSPQIPYVPTYLAFRELRGMLPVSMKCDFDAIFVDGHGVLHPRGLGEASHLGLLLGKPSIGVAKSKLVGEVEGGYVKFMGRNSAALHRGGFISPGHLSDLESALKASLKFWKEGNQPFPLKLAHSLSKSAKFSD